MSGLSERQAVMTLVGDAVAAGARQRRACKVVGISERTLQRWQAGEDGGVDRRTGRTWCPPHTLSAEERAAVLAVANSGEFGHLPPSQIVPRLADRGVLPGFGVDLLSGAEGREPIGASPCGAAWAAAP